MNMIVPTPNRLIVDHGHDVSRPDERLFFIIEQTADGRETVLGEGSTHEAALAQAATIARRRYLPLLDRIGGEQ